MPGAKDDTPPVRSLFGLKGCGFEDPDTPPNDGSLRAVLKTAVEDSSAAFFLYVIIVAGRSVVSPETRFILGTSDVWLWFALLVACNTFLQVFYPSLRRQLVLTSIGAVLLILVCPIKHKHLVDHISKH